MGLFSTTKAKFVPQVPDLKGQVIIVTGANSGIGFQATLILAEKGATIVMACRSIERSQPQLESVKAQFPDAKVELLQLDLANVESMIAFIGVFKSKYDRLDVLINNGGVILNRKLQSLLMPSSQIYL